MTAALRRHDLAYLRPGSAMRWLCAEPQAEAAAALAQWLELGRPLVVSRQNPFSLELQLALTLPTALGRQRLAGIFQRQDLLRLSPPLSLSTCLRGLDLALHEVLMELESRVLASGAALGVFGSLAWEILSGASYRHAASDLDLICDVETPAQLHACLQALKAAADKLPWRLDGEIRLPGSDAVAWRELAACSENPAARVLVKSLHEVSLKTLASLYADAAWPAERCGA